MPDREHHVLAHARQPDFPPYQSSDLLVMGKSDVIIGTDCPFSRRMQKHDGHASANDDPLYSAVHVAHLTCPARRSGPRDEAPFRAYRAADAVLDWIALTA